MLLLHLMFFLCPEKVRAIYIDHQLQALSADWGKFVAHQCQQLNIPCIIQPVLVKCLVWLLDHLSKRSNFLSHRMRSLLDRELNLISLVVGKNS